MPIKPNSELSRRGFIALAATGVAATVGSRGAWPVNPPIPTGIQLYTVNADLEKDPAATLKKIAQIGYTEVETAGFGKLSASQFRSLLADAGLRAPSAHLSFGMQETDKLLEDATTLGVAYVVSSVLLPQPPPHADMKGFLEAINSLTADDFKRTAAKANEIAQKAKAAGLQYAYHNHNFEFRDLGGGETGYDVILRETDPSLVKFEADTGWMRVAGADPIAFLTRFPGRYAMLHIKDFKNLGRPVTTLMAPDSPTPTELGRGSVDLKPIVAAGRKAGIKHMFVEQEPPFTEMSPLEAAAVDYTCLHSLLATV
jgi:sugar phosphate isomerase/epimerase